MTFKDDLCPFLAWTFLRIDVRREAETSTPKNDKTVMEAIKASNNGHHTQAAYLFECAGNQTREPSEKRELWAAADRSRRIANSK